jgi:hypothetical protein
MTLQVARVRPERKIDLGGYDLDAIAIEYDDDAHMFEFRYAYDFRFELGSGLGIFWALPIERNGRLRLAHVDGAAYTLDEPVLVADPWICDLPRLEWRGELKTFDDGTTLVAVAVEATSQPARYRCELVVLPKRGPQELICFEWRAGG